MPLLGSKYITKKKVRKVTHLIFFSGTSMASPFIAGIVALIEESRGGNRGISAMEVRSMLINNGHPVNIFSNESNNEIQVDSVARQGSGLVDLYGALVSDTMILPEQIRLNDIDHTAENNEYILTIHNNGRTRQEYEISHMVASSIQGYDQNSAIMNSIPLKSPVVHERSKVEAIVEIPIPYVTIDANNELNVTVRISPPLNAADVPASIYSGYIAVKKVAGEHNHQFIPYAGLTASISTLPVLMVNDTMPRIKSDFVSIVSPTVLSLQLTEASPLLSISAVDAKDITRNRGLIPGGYSTFIGRNTIDDPTDMMILSWFGNVVETTEQAGIGLLQHAAPKNKKSQQNKESGAGIDIALVGKQLETGVYKLKVMALRPFGDVNREEDYDVWYSPDIQLEGATNGPVS
jgi:hypothetical protein